MTGHAWSIGLVDAETDIIMFWSQKRHQMMVFSLRPHRENYQHLCSLGLRFHAIGLEAEVGRHCVFLSNQKSS